VQVSWVLLVLGAESGRRGSYNRKKHGEATPQCKGGGTGLALKSV
jgi:hypothetical protein